jgi:plastocyanin
MILALSGALAQEVEVERDGLPVEAWTVTASEAEGEVENAVDSDPSTVWTAAGDAGSYIEVDLGEAANVTRVHWLTGGDADTYPADFRVEVSSDGEDWEIVAETGEAVYEVFEGVLQVIFEPVEARQVRISLAAEQRGLSLSELYIYEEGQPVTVRIENFDYLPDVLVAEGTTVTWIQIDAAPHTVTEGPPGKPAEERVFDSSGQAEGDYEEMFPGDTYSFTFEEAGDYEYHCIPHPYMRGRVVVVTF